LIVTQSTLPAYFYENHISHAAVLISSCRGSYGPDVDFINRSLQYVFDRYTVDPARLGIAGFSDGASYALSLGLPNGDLFSHIIAFSPGFMRPPSVVRLGVRHSMSAA
jgi:predicted esterase